MVDLPELDSRFSLLTTEYESRRAAAYSDVVRWEWYDGEAFDLRPLWYERNLQRSGRRLEERPPLVRDHHRLGFDGDDRVVAMLEYSGFLGGRLNYETFRTYRAGLAEDAHFYADGRPIYLQEHHFEAGRIHCTASAATFGAGIETYDYDYVDGSVARITVHHAQRTSGRLCPATLHRSIEAAYDHEGLLRLTNVGAGRVAGTETLYERPPADFTAQEACRTVQAELMAQVPRAVQDLGIEAAAYCVVLVYANDYDPSDVTIHVGLEKDRQDCLAAGEDADVIWSPADMACDADVDMSAVKDTARLLRQELTLSRVAMSREVVRAVAASLAEFGWQAIMPVTDDFVVFAVDTEMADLEQNLAAAAVAGVAAEER